MTEAYGPGKALGNWCLVPLMELLAPLGATVMTDKQEDIKESIAARQADALAWFFSAHPPVETFAESNNYMTSAQVKGLIEQETEFFFPFIGDLKNALRAIGYVQEELDSQIVWLLAR